MSDPAVQQLLMWGMAGVFAVLWWLLRAKDAKQEADIRLLWEKHDLDAAALQELRLQIAARHYERNELDTKFEKLETAFRDGFRDLGNRFDELKNALLKNRQ